MIHQTTSFGFLSTTRITALGVYSVSNCRLIADWSVENMNPHMTPYGMPLDVNVLLKKRKKKQENNDKYNKHLILIRLTTTRHSSRTLSLVFKHERIWIL